MPYINFYTQFYTSKWSYWIEFHDANVAYCNMPLILVILLNFFKSSENRLVFWRHFEADNKILRQSQLKIPIPYEIFLQHSRVPTDKKAKMSENSRISVGKWVFELWELKSSTEQDWALFQHYFLTNSSTIFRLKIVSEPSNA